jgi:prepilin-type N-terminal cleavage/methylation domain-containing protein
VMVPSGAKSRGFTLVECVVAVAVGMAVLGAVYAAVWSGQRSATGIDRKVTTGQDARAALEVMAMEMRMASYNPGYATVTNPWTDITSCNAGDATRRGIQDANTAGSTIQIQMDLNGNGSCGDAANEIIVYALDTANRRITRQTWTCSGSPVPGGIQSFLGGAADEAKTVRVVNGDADVAIPVFRYFDKAGTDITSSLPGAIGQIRRIVITLVVDSENFDPSLGGSQRRRLIYSTSVIPRNHAVQF